MPIGKTALMLCDSCYGATASWMGITLRCN